MTKNKKAAGCRDTQTAHLNICGLNFTQMILTLKAACFRVGVWLSPVGGFLC
jgi:hypothetical protein